MGHLSRLAIIEILPRFFKFLESVLIYRAEQLSGGTLRYFAEWLKKDKGLSYSTAASMYRKISPVFLQMSRSEEHTSELQSLMRISYAVFCLKKKKIENPNDNKSLHRTNHNKEHTKIHSE